MTIKKTDNFFTFLNSLGLFRLIILGLVLINCCVFTLKSIENTKNTSPYLNFQLSQLSHYDPHVTDKFYYAPQNYQGIAVYLPDLCYDFHYELISGGIFEVEFYQADQFLGSVTTVDVLRQSFDAPAKAVTDGFDSIRFVPISGQLLFISYLQALPQGADTVIFQDYEPRPAWVASPVEAGNHMVDALLAHVVSATTTELQLDIRSMNNELGCSLLYIADAAGTKVAEFPANTKLAPYTAGDEAEIFTLDVLQKNYFTYDLILHYQYDGHDTVKTWEVNPYAQINEEIFEATTIRTKDNMSQFPNLTIEGKEVRFSGTEIHLSQSLFIPEGYHFYVDPGQSIYLSNNAFILCRSPIFMEGTADKPILVTTSDHSLYSGLVVMEAKEQSTVDYVTFDNLGEVQSGAWTLTGAVTFFESDVIIQNCNFLNNRSEDGLNSVRCNIEVRDTLFQNTFQDAYDADFCTGLFENVIFRDSGNDAFDVSTSQFHLKNCQFYDTWDKAISTGEASHVTGESLTIQGAQSALAAKDSSSLTVDDVTVTDVFIGICVYQKKPEYGPTEMTITNYTLLPPYDFDYIIEAQDTVLVNGEPLVSSNNKKQEIIIQYMIEEIEIS